MIDLRSDTVTKPTESMRVAMVDAVVGDDVYEEDPTVNDLEEYTAKLLGKEAALLVTSGTQGNQIAVLTHCALGNEVIMELESHLFHYEGAAISAFAGVQPRTILGDRGFIAQADLEAAIRSEDVHAPETGLICVENTHNRHGGAIITPEQTIEMTDVAKHYGIPTHLDGARLFNASVALGVDIKELSEPFTSVQICLSKGLGAPIGSVIAGDKAFINKARKWRKRLGGGMRQAGVIAAPGKIALTSMVERLKDDHTHAQFIAKAVEEIRGLTVGNQVDTNIVLLDTTQLSCTAQEFVNHLYTAGVKANTFGPQTVRIITHKDLSHDEIEKAIDTLRQVASYFETEAST
ncbi:low specificity L-threonine aldolase [Geomicrobium sp. JCM 19038]|uniref:threonine aldolase family protein n=1 Tax=Geomicrobium sp. JCM 19038 TaxID=1460635 RepID=UPI00045F1E33|nr:GntG family PLP-dependent aldolase [Geomicrobium sp. JCM 19038]GAK08735.1 low-specificity L-threonine aldolase [Geomicrobium sp. JCM 19038]